VEAILEHGDARREVIFAGTDGVAGMPWPQLEPQHGARYADPNKIRGKPE
jgi:hypothetical protein